MTQVLPRPAEIDGIASSNLDGDGPLGPAVRCGEFGTANVEHMD